MKIRILTAMYTPTLNRKATANDEKVASLRGSLALFIVWGTASLIFLFFYLSSGATISSQTENKNLSLIRQQQELLANYQAFNKQPEQTTAFVFVNIDKKFFLTRFPAGGRNDSVAEDAGVKNVLNSKSETPTVIRKIKASNIKNNYTDFSIKRVPQ